GAAKAGTCGNLLGRQNRAECRNACAQALGGAGSSEGSECSVIGGVRGVQGKGRGRETQARAAIARGGPVAPPSAERLRAGTRHSAQTGLGSQIGCWKVEVAVRGR